MSKTEHENNKQQEEWNTWEELLLAFAVKRHGLHNWQSVASELQTRTKLFTSPDSCRLKFLDLRRRFNQNKQDEEEDIDWVENLRRRRLDELRAHLIRHDLSIQSLQSKVKRLEQKPSDLEANRSDNNHDDDDVDVDVNWDVAMDDVGESSVNGSNSTAPNKGKECIGSDQNGIEPEMDGVKHVPPCSKRNESTDESSEGLCLSKKKIDMEEEGDGRKTDGSDVQSSATLSSRKPKGIKGDSAIACDDADAGSRAKFGSMANVLLSLVQSHKDASFFERQEGKMLNDMIRQHMDIQTIQSNLDSGFYASSHLNFYRDLILMFTNAIVFYPKSSPEHKVAQELRALVSEKMDEQFKQSQRSDEKLSFVPHLSCAKTVLERSDSLHGKQKLSGSGSGPIVVCRKRSLISSKGDSSGKGEQQDQSDVGDEMKTLALADLKPFPMEDCVLLSSKTKDRIVTGKRSLKRSNSSFKKSMTLPNVTLTATTSNSNKKEATTITAAATTTSTERKKEELSASKNDDNLAKKRGAADFLKRLKGNSPVKHKDGKSSDAKVNSSTAGSEQKKKNGNGNKVDGRRKTTTKQTETLNSEGDTSPTKRNVGRPYKKTPEAAKIAVKRVRDTEASGAGGSKQPKKRSKR